MSIEARLGCMETTNVMTDTARRFGNSQGLHVLTLDESVRRLCAEHGLHHPLLRVGRPIKERASESVVPNKRRRRDKRPDEPRAWPDPTPASSRQGTVPPLP